MGWSYCGRNSITGDEMGYSVHSTCACVDCEEEIDHGLSYVCGGMHEGGEYGCGRYFCSGHLSSAWFLINGEQDSAYNIFPTSNDRQLCMKCEKELLQALKDEYGEDNVEFE